MSETSEDFDFEVCECFAKRQAKNLIKHPKEIMKIVDERSPPNEHINSINVIDLLRTEFSGLNSESPINSTERELAKKVAKEILSCEKYFVRLCQDGLLEVMRFGNRRRLTKLERIGRRFHLSVEYFFRETPFLRVDLLLEKRELDVSIDGNERIPTIISYNNLSDLPKFLRFDEVCLNYSSHEEEPTLSFEERVQMFTNYLKALKSALNDSNLTFFANTQFSIHSKFLDTIKNGFLPFCDSSRGCKFNIWLNSDKKGIIASILKMFQDNRCSSIEINLFMMDSLKEWPVDEISNWLHRKYDIIHEKPKERFLRIYLNWGYFNQDILKLIDHLKKRFKENNFRLRPYTFKLEIENLYFDDQKIIGDNKEEILTNKKTNEELLIRTYIKKRRFGTQIMMEIKRGALRENVKTLSSKMASPSSAGVLKLERRPSESARNLGRAKLYFVEYPRVANGGEDAATERTRKTSYAQIVASGGRKG